MSRHTERVRRQVGVLVDELTIGAALRMRRDADEIRPVVQAVVCYLMSEYPSQDLYIPASTADDVDGIIADIRAGKSMRAICSKHRRDRRTIYRLIDRAEGAG